jgi:hypothetical protein
MHTFRGRNFIFLMHKLLIKYANYLHCLKCAKVSIYCIAKDRGRYILISKQSIYCHHKKGRDC